MKRDQLKELGLSDEQIKSVMDLNGEDINKAKSGNAEMVKENESLKSQLAERDKDIKGLRKNAKDNDELSQQLQDLQSKYKQDHENLTNEVAKVKLNGAIDNALTHNQVRNTKAFKALLDMDSIKLNDQGQLTGLDDQIKSIRKSDPYLFNEGNKQNYQPNNGKPTQVDETQEMIDVFKGGAN